MGQKATVELVLDCEEPQRLAKFWCEALDYRDYYADANLAVLVPKEGIASPLLLQGVPEPKSGKNRMHLDIVVDDIEAEVRRLQDPHRLAACPKCGCRNLPTHCAGCGTLLIEEG